jgi:hypothetical protein
MTDNIAGTVVKVEGVAGLSVRFDTPQQFPDEPIIHVDGLVIIHGGFIIPTTNGGTVLKVGDRVRASAQLVGSGCVIVTAQRIQENCK